jgi:putative ABC transport system permease protein
MHTLGQIFESFRFAWRALKSNVLRTILSLLGVTIGIFAIIAVLTIVDSLKKNITDSLSMLGNGVLYVAQRPFAPEGNGPYKWWEYIKRPQPSYNEYRFLLSNLTKGSSIAINAFRGNVVLKYRNNSMTGALFGGTFHYKEVFNVDIEKGRYFTMEEGEGATQVGLIGFEVSKILFPNEDPIGKLVRIKGLNFTIIGLIKQEGQNIFGGSSHDFTVLVPYQAFRKIYQTGTGRPDELGSMIGVKGMPEDFGLVEAENELRGIMRGRRGLKPTEKENFAINRPEAIANAINGVFDILSVAGWVIGGFSILVGGFGIANIMFVSVKERTSIIGLQKSLGAKNYFILFQFLFEAIFLSLIGGLGGLFLVYLITFLPFGSLEVVLTAKNIALGLGVSSTIGMVAGIIPAAMAARLDPVIAIRSNG